MEVNKQNTGNKENLPLPPKKKDTTWKRWVKFIWIGFFALVLGISGLFFAVSQGFLGEMPDVKELENPDIYVASQITLQTEFFG
jgi:penicillin-binding protein 1A